jgi:hypothetical protein
MGFAMTTFGGLGSCLRKELNIPETCLYSRLLGSITAAKFVRATEDGREQGRERKESERLHCVNED